MALRGNGQGKHDDTQANCHSRCCWIRDACGRPFHRQPRGDRPNPSSSRVPSCSSSTGRPQPSSSQLSTARSNFGRLCSMHCAARKATKLKPCCKSSADYDGSGSFKEDKTTKTFRVAGTGLLGTLAIMGFACFVIYVMFSIIPRDANIVNIGKSSSAQPSLRHARADGTGPALIVRLKSDFDPTETLGRAALTTRPTSMMGGKKTLV